MTKTQLLRRYGPDQDNIFRAPIVSATGGSVIIVGAVGGKRIKVINWLVAAANPAAAFAAAWYSGANQITGTFGFLTSSNNAPFKDECLEGCFETLADSEDLVLLVGAGTAEGYLSYVLIDA